MPARDVRMDGTRLIPSEKFYQPVALGQAAPGAGRAPGAEASVRKAIAAGINIIHINTELRVAWRRSLGESLARDPNEVVPYRILRPVVDSVKQVVSSRLRLFHGEPVSSGAVGSVA